MAKKHTVEQIKTRERLRLTPAPLDRHAGSGSFGAPPRRRSPQKAPVNARSQTPVIPRHGKNCRRALLLLLPLFLLAAGCEQIDSPSERNCRAIHSELVSKVNVVLIPELDDVETFDQYVDFVDRYYESLGVKDEAFRTCLRLSAYTASEAEMQRWIQTGVALTGIRFFWERLIEDPGHFGPSNLDYLIERDRNLLMRIVEKESSPPPRPPAPAA